MRFSWFRRNGLSCLSVHVDAEEVVEQERIITFSPVVKKDQRVSLILNYRHTMDFPDDHLGAFMIRLARLRLLFRSILRWIIAASK